MEFEQNQHLIQDDEMILEQSTPKYEDSPIMSGQDQHFNKMAAKKEALPEINNLEHLPMPENSAENLSINPVNDIENEDEVTVPPANDVQDANE